jgi:hypothetical protein
MRLVTPVVASLLLLCAFVASAPALEAGPDDVYIRVVDVGPGLCVVAKIPSGHHLVFDAGHWDNKE